LNFFRFVRHCAPPAPAISHRCISSKNATTSISINAGLVEERCILLFSSRNSTTSDTGRAPLHTAVLKQNRDIVEFLAVCIFCRSMNDVFTYVPSTATTIVGG
jgi:hypothetical protein